jgi:hypothetical protein
MPLSRQGLHWPIPRHPYFTGAAHDDVVGVRGYVIALDKEDNREDEELVGKGQEAIRIRAEGHTKDEQGYADFSQKWKD